MDDNENEGTTPTAVESSTVTENDQKFLDQQRRAEKAEAEVKALKEQLPKPLPTEKSDPFDIVAENLSLLRDLSNEEVEAIRKEAKDLGTTPAKYLTSNSGKTFLKSMRDERRIAQTTPPPSNRTAQPGEVLIRDAADVVIDKDGKIVRTPHVSFRDWEVSRKGRNSSE